MVRSFTAFTIEAQPRTSQQTAKKGRSIVTQPIANTNQIPPNTIGCIQAWRVVRILTSASALP
jgi:hypothetical protein